MASKVDWGNLQGYKKHIFSKNDNTSSFANDFVVTIEGSCPTGFESAFESEIKEKFPSSVTVKHQGRVFFDVPISCVKKVLELRCADNIYALIGVRNNFDFSGDAEECYQRINNLLHDEVSDNQDAHLAWNKGLIAWNEVFKFKTVDKSEWETLFSSLTLQNANKHILSTAENPEKDTAKKVIEKNVLGSIAEKNMDVPTFRATCYRSGQNCHPFGSMEVACSFGGAINDKFGWGVSLKNFDLEVVITIDINQVYVAIGLTKESLFKRNIAFFGPTTLRATICAGLLRLANIQPGEIVVDPLCGGASIPIEGAVGFSKGFHIGGDIHDKAAKRSIDNLNYLTKHLTEDNNSKIYMHVPCDVFQWDATQIPMKDNSVDVFISDLPFGKRSGSKWDNRFFYTKVMNSMARVVRPNTGRAILLTQDKNSMFKSEGKFKKFWKINRQLYCNIGGLSSLVFLMTRTNASP